ncbi:SDH family Clp fold serine proteinase [Microbacterium sp. NPDC088796]
MPAWNELLEEFEQLPPEAKGAWMNQQFGIWLNRVSELRNDKNVVLYGSGWLQKQNVPQAYVSITHEDLNGLMAVIKGMDFTNGLTLILHTPGGVTNATESLVDYLRAKFPAIEVIVPTYAMSAGTMISMAADRIVMARHSQLGPIDPQMPMPGGRSYSARAIVDQFEQAKAEITADQVVAHAWAPVLASLGPALVKEASNNLEYSEKMVANWLEKYMLAGDSDAATRSTEIAHYFADNSHHKSHGRRIGRDEAEAQGLVIEPLEDDQDFQEAVLTVYHLMTIWFEQTLATKIIWSSMGSSWLKNWGGTT